MKFAKPPFIRSSKKRNDGRSTGSTTIRQKGTKGERTVNIREYHAANYASMLSNDNVISKKIEELAGPYLPRAKRILDVGCNNGHQLSTFIGKGAFALYGVDICKGAIRNKVHPSLHLFLCDVEKGLPFRNGFFDLVICSEVIEHVFDTDFLLKEIKRVLAHSGVAIITTPNMLSAVNRVRALLGKQLHLSEFRAQGAGHIRFYVTKGLRDQVREYLTVVKTGGVNFPFILSNAGVKRLMMRMGDFSGPLCRNIYVVAKKE